jgi:hypothetical protein
MHSKDHVELEVAFTRRKQSSPVVVMMWVGNASEMGRMPNRKGVKIPPQQHGKWSRHGWSSSPEEGTLYCTSLISELNKYLQRDG